MCGGGQTWRQANASTPAHIHTRRRDAMMVFLRHSPRWDMWMSLCVSEAQLCHLAEVRRDVNCVACWELREQCVCEGKLCGLGKTACRSGTVLIGVYRWKNRLLCRVTSLVRKGKKRIVGLVKGLVKGQRSPLLSHTYIYTSNL